MTLRTELFSIALVVLLSLAQQSTIAQNQQRRPPQREQTVTAPEEAQQKDAQPDASLEKAIKDLTAQIQRLTQEIKTLKAHEDALVNLSALQLHETRAESLEERLAKCFVS